MATMHFALAQVMNVVLKENPNYPMSAFISDAGGAAGLFLGLDILREFPNIICVLNILCYTSKLTVNLLQLTLCE